MKVVLIPSYAERGSAESRNDSAKVSLQLAINKHKVDVDREVFVNTNKSVTKAAKLSYKAALKHNKAMLKESQTEFLKQILNSNTPNWGGAMVKQIDL